MILASGCFDGLHAGHVAYLRLAAALCEEPEWLIVAVAGDEYIRRHKRREPTWNFAARSNVVSELRCVDQVWMHGPSGAAGVIRRVRPRIFVKGKDWELLGLPDDVMAACADIGCLIAFVDSGPHRHTSDALSPHQ